MGLQLHVRQRVRTRLGFEVRVEQRIHQRGLTETSFPDAKDVEHEPILDALADQLVRHAVEPDMAGQFQGTGKLVLKEEQNRQCLLSICFRLRSDKQKIE